MLFQRPSLRTRVTFEAGMSQLGGHAIYLADDTVLGARESVRDVARNLDRCVDALVARAGPHEIVVGARGPGRDPGHQRAHHPRASVPGAGRCVHAPGAVRAARRARPRLRRRRQQRLPLPGAARARARARGPPRPSARLRARMPGSSSGRANWPMPGAGDSSSRRTRSKPSRARRSSTRTPGPRWARRPRQRSGATRSAATR